MLILGCPRIEANEFRVLATLELFATVLDNADDLANAGLELFGAEEFFSKDVPAPRPGKFNIKLKSNILNL